eukprot:1548294-Prymnesium_polylepis.1
MRIAPSDVIAAELMVSILANLWNYTSFALVHSQDTYGAGGAIALANAADAAGLTIVTTQRFVKDTEDFEAQLRQVDNSNARVIVLYCHAGDGS